MKYRVRLYESGKSKGWLKDHTGKPFDFDSIREAENTVGVELTQMEFTEGKWSHKIMPIKR